MMALTEPKPFASLGPTLLARKGGAKPAMRPQLAAAASQEPVDFAQDLEDLGWNDMGEEEGDRRETALVALTPAPHPHELAEDEEIEAEEPEVRRQQRTIAETIAAEREDEMPIPQTRAGDSRRAAFTLRLDAKRHLKLRLASTVKNRSAQALVTQALDRFLADIPELDTLASQLNRD